MKKVELKIYSEKHYGLKCSYIKILLSLLWSTVAIYNVYKN